MKIIGVTGSIGMGKTTVAGQFAYLGCPSHNSDKAVHHALQPGGGAFEEVAVTFPEAWDKKKHIIRKDVLSKLVFTNEKKRKELEDILHPIVRCDQGMFIRKQKKMGRDRVVLDIPLLFETGAEARVHYTVLASAPFFIQRMRVLKRKGMTEEKFIAILESQMPDVEKRKRADFIVQTGLGRAFSMSQVKQILKEI
jgi:dephospho-CoA kinase